MGLLVVILSLTLASPAKDGVACDGKSTVDLTVPGPDSRRREGRGVDDLTPDYVDGPWLPLPEEHPFHPVTLAHCTIRELV